MPLPPAEQKRMLLGDFQGINIERSVLVRPENSWAELENFDLVKPGVIRKILGNKLITSEPIPNDFFVALADYQKVVTGAKFIAGISAAGTLYHAVPGSGDPLLFISDGELYPAANGVLAEAPYVVSLSFEEDGENVQYLVITLDSKDFPKKWNGLAITRLGVVNPTDTWTILYQHSAIIPINSGSAPGQIQYLTDNELYGIPITVGRQIRWSWYNPTTGHDSSLAALSQTEWIIPAGAIDIDTPQISRPAGIVKGLFGKNFVMAYFITLDNLPDRSLTNFVLPPQPGYTQIRYWATRDGGEVFYLLPKLYDNFGLVISDENGAVNINEISYGLQYTLFDAPNNGVVYDGFIPITEDGPVEPSFAVVLLANVVGGGQTGNTLNVLLTAEGVSLKRSHIRIGTDTTVYAVLDVTVGAPDQLVISPDLVTSPPDGAEIRPIFTLPTPDTLLITQFDDGTEQPFDRVNDPPPMACWGAVYQNRLFLLDLDKITLWYSRLGRYESFPPLNFFRFSRGDFDPITAILTGRQVGLVSEGADSRLIIAKEESTYQITGTSVLDFAVTSLFSETGILHKRAAIVLGGYTVVQSRQGLEVLQGQMPFFIGTKIKDLIDLTHIEEYGPCFALDRKNEQVLMGLDFVANTSEELPAAGITRIITMRSPRQIQDGSLSPFATITTIPGGPLAVIQECGFSDTTRILCAGFDGNIYQLFIGGLNVVAGGDPEPVIAVAISQQLPQSDRESRKIFRRVRFDGNGAGNNSGWMISYKVDDALYTTEVEMFDECLIGRVGKQITIKMRHITEVFDPPPQLSNMTLDYALIGEAR
mgnify:CR=1 FL=1